MTTAQKFSYDDFILLNDHLSFHPGGLIATFNMLSNVPGLGKDQTILDFGSGNGLTLSFLQRLGYNNLIGFDRNLKAIEFSRQKWPGIMFYDNLEELMENEPSIDLLFLESVLGFNDESELFSLSNVLRKLIKKSSIKYVGIIDFYAKSVLPVGLSDKIKSTFNIKKIRNIDELKSVFNLLFEGLSVNYFHEHAFYINLSEQYTLNDQISKLKKSQIFSHVFDSELETELFFSKFIENMLGSYSKFGEYLKYFECVLVDSKTIINNQKHG